MRAKLSKSDYWLTAFLWVVVFVFGGVGLSSGNAVDTFAWMLGAVLALFIGAVGLLWDITQEKKIAAGQCLAVSDKYNLGLTTWQARSLEAKVFARQVFKEFEAILGEKRADLIPEHFFVASGGKTSEGDRCLVELLWWQAQNEQPPAVEETSASQPGEAAATA